MSWEAVSALATLASAIVVAVAATAAVMQIRHIHLGNQLEVVLRIYERYDSGEMAEARRYVYETLPDVIQDEPTRRAMAATVLDPRIAVLTGFYMEIGALIADGLLEERLINRLGPSVARAWNVLAPLAAELRSLNPEPIWAGFEFFAALHERTTADQRIRRYPRWFQARLRRGIGLIADEAGLVRPSTT